jgi:DTW domain-containing protein YfiP
MCWRCFWPRALCWCPTLVPMATRTRFLILMHPKEWKRERAATGRLTRLCLTNAEIRVGIGFDGDAGLRATLDDPGNRCVLLAPGPGAVDLSREGAAPLDPGGRRLVMVVLDGTWSLARKMFRESPCLHGLPRAMFGSPPPSRFVIKKQPRAECLSTLEAVHESLLALDRAGLDRYPIPAQLPDLFERMQAIQIRCAADPSIPGYRRRPYRGVVGGGGPKQMMPSSWTDSTASGRTRRFPGDGTGASRPDAGKTATRSAASEAGKGTR